MLDVSIIIVNYGTERLVTDCISSILKKTEGVTFEIIIVDNASPGNSFAFLEEKYKDAENIKTHALKDNVGFGRANNAGYELSSGRNIFCLNPDTELKNNAIAILSDYLDSNPTVGACCGNLLQSDGKPATSYRRLYPSLLLEFSFMTNYLIEKVRFNGSHKYNHTNNIINVATISGADLMVRRSVIEEVGFFDPTFFMYYEDTDLCYRIFKNNYSLRNLPQALIYHYEGKSTNRFDHKAALNFDGRSKFYSKHYSKPYQLVANLVWGAAVGGKAITLLFKKDSNLEYWITSLKLLIRYYKLSSSSFFLTCKY